MTTFPTSSATSPEMDEARALAAAAVAAWIEFFLWEGGCDKMLAIAATSHMYMVVTLLHIREEERTMDRRFWGKRRIGPARLLYEASMAVLNKLISF